MISTSAQKSLETIFLRAARTTLPLHADDAIAIMPLLGSKAVDFPERQVLILTISSFTFRLLLIFHIDDDVSTSSYFQQDKADRSFVDAFAEMANLFCGAMNRELLKTFLHLGMSTPYVLGRASMGFIDVLKPGFLASYRIDIRDDVHLHATLCLCESEDIETIHVDMDVEAGSDTGELELF